MLKAIRTMRSRRGQSTLEYIILVAAIIAALIVFLNGTFKSRVSETLDTGTNSMVDMANRLNTR